MFFVDPLGLEGETKHKSAGGVEVPLPEKAKNIKKYKKNSTKGKDTGNSYSVEKGGIKSFDVNGKTYKANFNTETGEFAGYKDGDDNYWDFSDTQENLLEEHGNVIPAFSIPVSVATQLGLLDGSKNAAQLLKEGLFQMDYNGLTNTYSINFFGNQHVEADLVQAAKSDFKGASTAYKVLNGVAVVLNFC